ncbi:putative quinol monooxygenase [Marinilactibacillus psychrotolerans]|uniref:Antibiotic biosynthesis monooxygenase n=1 Tax=Marinilactibacillus psychrotolerans TaxID=191770 RepID=A0A5R9C1F2_9LACT|nr:putative quinol monooxygenase [Marinilactibacillus psychrotolerans]TLQ06531.1 antibiotic biosynthesis monooxygenase [Marinilactibacillus psychrotolerans]
MKMINASFFIKEDKREEFLSVVNPLIQATREEEGCVQYNLYESVEEANAFMMVEIWEDQNAIDGHNKSPLLLELFNKIPEFSSKKPIVRVSEMGE